MFPEIQKPMYSVTVRIEGVERRRRSAGLFHILVGFFMIAEGADYFKLLNYQEVFRVLPVMLIGAFSLFYGFFRRRIDLAARYNYWLRLLQVIAFAYLGLMMTEIARPIDYISVFSFAFLCILLMFSERRIFMETTLFLEIEGIRIPGYYRDHLVYWKDLENVTIREDFITLFHVKQKYLQYQVMQDLSLLELAKLNAFCKEQIEGVSSEKTIKG